MEYFAVAVSGFILLILASIVSCAIGGMLGWWIAQKIEGDAPVVFYVNVEKAAVNQPPTPPEEEGGGPWGDRFSGNN